MISCNAQLRNMEQSLDVLVLLYWPLIMNFRCVLLQQFLHPDTSLLFVLSGLDVRVVLLVGVNINTEGFC